MSDILHTMAELTVTIDGHFRGSNPVYDLQHLVDRRQVCQYRLLMLSSEEELCAGDVEVVWLYEAVRWTMLIYRYVRYISFLRVEIDSHLGDYYTIRKEDWKRERERENANSQPTLPASQ